MNPLKPYDGLSRQRVLSPWCLVTGGLPLRPHVAAIEFIGAAATLTFLH